MSCAVCREYSRTAICGCYFLMEHIQITVLPFGGRHARCPSAVRTTTNVCSLLRLIIAFYARSNVQSTSQRLQRKLQPNSSAVYEDPHVMVCVPTVNATPLCLSCVLLWYTLTASSIQSWWSRCRRYNMVCSLHSRHCVHQYIAVLRCCQALVSRGKRVEIH